MRVLQLKLFKSHSNTGTLHKTAIKQQITKTFPLHLRYQHHFQDEPGVSHLQPDCPTSSDQESNSLFSSSASDKEEVF